MSGDGSNAGPAKRAGPPASADAAVRTALRDGHRHILGFLRRRLGSAEEAEEVLQAFSLRALNRSADLRGVETIRGWLSRILATTIIDHQRRAGRRRRREEVMSPDDMEAFFDPAGAAMDEAVCQCLHELLPTLKPDHAEVIRRIDLQEEPRDQVAASLGVSLNALGVRLHRARQAMKQRLEEMCLTCPLHGFLDCDCEEAARAQKRRAALASTFGL